MPQQRNVRRFGKQQQPKQKHIQDREALAIQSSTFSSPNQTNLANSDTPHVKSSNSPLSSQTSDILLHCEETTHNNFRCVTTNISIDDDVGSKGQISGFPIADIAKQDDDPSNCDMVPLATCVACRKTIFDRFVMQVGAANRPYHELCLRCSMCNVPLSNEQSCFVKDDVVYCKRDYMR